MRIIDKAVKNYSGNDQTGKKINELMLQLEYKKNIIMLVATNRETSAYLLNSDKKWTKLKSFKRFDYDYDNIDINFLKDAITYLNSFYDTKDFSFKKLGY